MKNEFQQSKRKYGPMEARELEDGSRAQINHRAHQTFRVTSSAISRIQNLACRGKADQHSSRAVYEKHGCALLYLKMSGSFPLTGKTS